MRYSSVNFKTNETKLGKFNKKEKNFGYLFERFKKVTTVSSRGLFSSLKNSVSMKNTVL